MTRPRQVTAAAITATATFAVLALLTTGANAEPPVGPTPRVEPAGPGTTITAFGHEERRVAETAAALGLPSSEALTFKTVLVDTDGTRHTRYDRTFNGLRVIGGDLIVRRSPDDTITRITRNTDGAVAVPTTTPAVDADTARATIPTPRSGQLTSSAAELVVYADRTEPVLAYEVISQGANAEGMPIEQRTYVSADDGSVITSFDSTMTGEGRGVHTGKKTLSTTRDGDHFTLADGGHTVSDAENTDGPGTVMTSPDDTWGDGTTGDRASVGADAKLGIEKTDAFYAAVLKRDGFDGRGGGVDARVHVKASWTNATFSMPNVMRIGDGKDNGKPLSSLDVVAHEMSHGLTFSTAGLVYRGESGGLNEATSDILGTATEFHAGLDVDTGDYLIGELVDLRGDGSPLRYMDQPSRDGKSFDCWSEDIGDADVHYSSGPLNHWYYLVAEGSGKKTVNGVEYNSPTCDDSTLGGVGRDVPTAVWYRAVSTKLTHSSDYADAREAAIASAKELYGGDSDACRAVEAGFSAVGVQPGDEACAGDDAKKPAPAASPGVQGNA